MVPEEHDASSDLARGRACYEQRRWADAAEALSRAQRVEALGREDLERLAWSAALTGDDDAFLGALERLYTACDEDGRDRAAARAAFWLGFRLLMLGASARGAGWLTRAQRHVDSAGAECAERGYLLLPTIFGHLAKADHASAEAAASEAAAIGERCEDRDLVAIARNLQGRALMRQGRIDAGLALLDELVIPVTGGALSPLVTGLVYCNVIATCQQAYAFDRAREWTAALARWCTEQPQLVTFTGNCRVHRSEIMQLGGDWPAALDEVSQVCEGAPSRADPEVFADACYQQGELLRLRGAFAEAEAAYHRASGAGRDPQPGLALLRLAQDRAGDAVSGIERALTTTGPDWQRARLLPAAVEILLAAGERGRAAAAAEELDVIARAFGTPILGAMAAHARGAVCLAAGDARGAVDPLRHAFGVWHRLAAPYIAARIRLLLADAYEALGDRDGARLERHAARGVFGELGAAPDLAALDAAGAPDTTQRHGLSPRERQVLALLASGRTNKAIAAELCVSQRTVDRHVSNIFGKIDVSSRAAATAFAYENGLV